MLAQARLFLCALQFLTRLPTPALKSWPADGVARSAIYYPVVGWIVGGICAAVLLIADRFWPPLVGAALSTVVGLLITAGLHEDGLADTADGFGGGRTPERRREIMKDSRIGAYGVLALWALLTVKTLAVAALPPPRAALALILAHGAARAFPTMAMTAPYAGDPAKAKLGSARVRPREAAIAALLGLSPLVLFPWPQAIVGMALAAAGAGLITRTARSLIGGWTGDALGAIEQVSEVALLLGFSASFAL